MDRKQKHSVIRREWLTCKGGDGGGGTLSGEQGKTIRKTKEAAGCMSAVFQLLHFQPPSNLDNHITSTSGGAEAPRSGPMLNQQTKPAANDKEDGELDQTNFPVIQVKSRRDDELSLDSPGGAKTPSLVARLMGLDLLPECASPSTLSGLQVKSQLQLNLLRSINGARSLPETPRMSLARRSSEFHSPRLSLQINRGNVKGECEFSERLRESSRLRVRDENVSQVISARHFVEKVKDRVSRRRSCALADITNDRDRNREKTVLRRRDVNLIPVKVKPAKITQSGAKTRRVSENSEKKNSRQNIKSKRTPLLNDPNLLQVKKDPSPPPTRLPPKQLQVSDALSSKRSTRLSVNQTHLYSNSKKPVLPHIGSGCSAAVPGGAAAEYGNYIQKIIERAGIINEATPFTSDKPIDPSIFHYLELFRPISAAGNAVLSRRCNRKLIFQLVNELVTEISTPHFNSNRWVSPIGVRDGDSPLVGELCKRIGGFQAAGCLVLEGVDSLVERDLRELESKELIREEERMVCEIEGEIVEMLLCETAAVAVRARRRKHVTDGLKS